MVFFYSLRVMEQRKDYILYKLTDPNNLVYYGLTSNLDKRMALHKSSSNRASSKQLDLENVIVESVMELKDFFFVDACKIESGYIKNNECVNKLVSYASAEDKKETTKKWQLKNKELIKAKRRVRYLKNKKENNNQSLNWYYENKTKVNEKFTCECGGKFTYRHKHDHIKTKKHLHWLKNQDSNTIVDNKNITKGIDGYFQKEQTAIQAS